MNYAFSVLNSFLLLFLAALIIPVTGLTQDEHNIPNKKTKENFDESWQFHKGDIAFKRVIQAGGQGGLTDVNVNALKADGSEVAVVRVAIQDSKGRVMPTADNLVQFSIEGPGKIIGTGNGNPSSHEPLITVK
jgi:hypothetical protein